MEEERHRVPREAVGSGSRGSPSGLVTRQEEEEEETEEDGPGCPVGEAVGEADAESEQEALLWRTASCYSGYLTAGAGGEIQHLERSLEEMLTRVDEFCGMLDMIRNDSSQIMNENIPEIHAKADEMKQLYKKIDKLELQAFVKMIGQNVCVLDDQVTKAEAELGTFPSAFRKILHSIGTPAFLNKSSFPKRQQQIFEPPALFRTEDYFPVQNSQPRE
ncbi:biogenesis of lysosome-related organelles complex 1 subunit 4-like isoform X1 [Carcharodon carcharias]|uniref:biogenesis of lysosome-related organelles complex 1 subunit 4-like isoform X1 n=1 Tax=Carcharodon carcharias TaxID=13397 RepID=UPI001B7EB512|nr:biogenesis of lysosome-related organelles complex 1 subunit 4-like isoform X1 [Carcharodon carcharias]